MEGYCIETIALCKNFKHQHAVSNMHMKVTKGAIYGFIGRNGAGKSTTLKMICGLSKPTSGEIRLFNQNQQEQPFDYRRIGMLIEQVGAYPNMSAKDNMKLKAIGLGIHNQRQIDELLELVNIKKAGNKKVRHFSVGMKQRLGIALALLGNPDILILDEPMNGLDPEGIKEMRNVIKVLNQQGITIVISSHMLGELSKIATHYGIIKDGELIEQLSKAELDVKCRNHLTIAVDDVKRAVCVLEQNLHIHDYEVQENDEIWIYQESNEELATILMKHQIKISQMYYQKQDLESYFLNRIGGVEHA